MGLLTYLNFKIIKVIYDYKSNIPEYVLNALNIKIWLMVSKSMVFLLACNLGIINVNILSLLLRTRFWGERLSALS